MWPNILTIPLNNNSNFKTQQRQKNAKFARGAYKLQARIKLLKIIKDDANDPVVNQRLVFNLIIFDDSQAFCNAFDFRDDFFLHQIKAHS